MKDINNQNLEKLIDYYYQTEEDLLNVTTISKELDINYGELRNLLKYLEICNFIYNTGRGYNVFKTKRQFKTFTKVEDKGTYLIYSTPDYRISLNKKEMDILEPNFKIKTIQNLIYMLFIFTIKLNIHVQPKIYIKNNEFWYKKESCSLKDDSIVFMCEFTQHSSEISLVNKK